MKNLLKTLAIALFLGITFTSNAEEKNSTPMKSKTFEVGMYQSINTLTMVVNIEKTRDDALSIVLKDESGNVISKSLATKKSQTYRGKFDMSELKDGKYSFEFTKGNEKIVKDVELQSNTPKEIIRQISLD
jgi:glucose uptake protein GlcU